MRTFLGKGAKPGPALQDLVASLAGCLPFCPAKKEAKKPPLIPRRGARPKGPAGPFGNPGASRGSPETVSVSHKAKALCYNTVSFLPERLIRAPVLKPRPRSRAGGSAVNICLIHLPVVPGRFVGAACMRPVPVRLMATVLVCVRGTLICRGGIYASRQGCVPRGVPGSLPVSCAL